MSLSISACICSGVSVSRPASTMACASDGKVDGSGQSAAFHNCDRMAHFEQWKNTSSTATTRTSSEPCPGPPAGRAAIDPDDRAGPADAQRLVLPGDQEEKAHPVVLQNVCEGVCLAVFPALGDRQRPVVEDVHEARRIALRRHVDRSAAVGRSDHHVRARGDERPAMPVQRVDVLGKDPMARVADDRPQLLFGRDELAEHGSTGRPETLTPGYWATSALRPEPCAGPVRRACCPPAPGRSHSVAHSRSRARTVAPMAAARRSIFARGVPATVWTACQPVPSMAAKPSSRKVGTSAASATAAIRMSRADALCPPRGA